MELHKSASHNDLKNSPATMPDAETRNRLYEIIEKGDWAIRLRAAGVLVDMGDPAGWSTLADAAGHPQKDIRGAALEIMAEYGGMDAVDFLEMSLFDEDPEIRITAAHYLQTLFENTPPKNRDILVKIDRVLHGNQISLPPYPPEIERKLHQMELIFGLIGIAATLLALVILVLDLEGYRIPFVLLVIAAAAGFTGNRGMERRDHKGYFLAMAGSLFLLPGFPLFTIPGVLFIVRLLSKSYIKAFEFDGSSDKFIEMENR